MNRFVFSLVVVLALGIVCTDSAISQDSSKSAATVIVHGPDLLSTDATMADVGAAIFFTHDKLCNWIPDGAGDKSDPSFTQSSRYWKSTLSPQSPLIAFLRATADFNDKQGIPIHIETTQEPGRPIFILIEYQGNGGPMAIAKCLLAQLQKQGIRLQ